MKELSLALSEILEQAFVKCGYGSGWGKVELCAIEGFGDYQCNGAMSLAKTAKKSPIILAQEVVDNLPENTLIEKCEVAKPGFINIYLSSNYLAQYAKQYVALSDEYAKQGVVPQKIIVDFGGPNVAKPLHVGHLRSAIIGESIKRLCAYVGNHTLGDVHLGDWGLQMGMIIAEIKRRFPSLAYFNDNHKGSYPTTSPVDIVDLETLYPEASARAKSNDEFMEQARKATYELQNGHPGYVALWKNVLEVSKQDLKENYDRLNVSFDLWLGESDSHSYVEGVVNDIKAKGFAYISQGALIVDLSKPEDKKEIPPFMLVKTDGSILYSTTEIATLIMRVVEHNVDRVIYVVDNRQEMHFVQLQRVVEKTNILNKPVKIDFAGFGTMNGSDGKPYKTRDGGLKKLSSLIDDVYLAASEKINLNRENAEEFSPSEVENIANVVSLATLKFADLSIYRNKDYVFDIDKFVSFEGKTGPYLLYTITRIKSILNKSENGNLGDYEFIVNADERALILAQVQFSNAVALAYNNLAPSYICDYAYKLANQFNNFYAKHNILKQADKNKRNTWLALCKSSVELLEKALNLLGIKTLDRM